MGKRCECGKRIYHTEQDAANAANSLARVLPDGSMPLAPYESCGGWHLTSSSRQHQHWRGPWDSAAAARRREKNKAERQRWRKTPGGKASENRYRRRKALKKVAVLLAALEAKKRGNDSP